MKSAMEPMEWIRVAIPKVEKKRTREDRMAGQRHGAKREFKVATKQCMGSDNLERNMLRLEHAIETAVEFGAELLLTPECALSGYASVDRDSNDSLDASTLAACEDHLAGAASSAGIALALGTSTPTEGGWHNSLLWIDPDTGTRTRYHKRALYGEDARYYVPGVDAAGSVVDFRGWRIGLRICFEFRFPEYFRELLLADVDLALVPFCMVGAKGTKREIATAHLQSRAAENGIFLATANSIRAEQEAPSCVIDPEGNILLQAEWDVEGLICATCSRSARRPLVESIRAHAKTLM